MEELDRPTLLRLIKRTGIGERKAGDGREAGAVRIHCNFTAYIEA